MEKLDLRIHFCTLKFPYICVLGYGTENVETGFVVSILFGVRNLSRLATYIGFSHLCGYVCFKFHDVDGRRIDIRRTVERCAFDEAVRAICSLVF